MAFKAFHSKKSLHTNYNYEKHYYAKTLKNWLEKEEQEENIETKRDKLLTVLEKKNETRASDRISATTVKLHNEYKNFE